MKEPFGRIQSIIIISTIVGIFFITRLPVIIISNLNSKTNVTDLIDYSQVYSQLSIEQKDGYNKLIGISCGILSTIFVSLTYIILRMANKVHSAVIVFNMGWVALTELFLLSLVLNKFSLPSQPYQLLLIGLLGVFSYAGQIFLIKSLQLENCWSLVNRHPFWHLYWHPLKHPFKHPFWHPFKYPFWHPYWHLLKHPFWHPFKHPFWHYRNL